MIKLNKDIFLILILFLIYFIFIILIPKKYTGFNKETIIIKKRSSNWHDTAKILKDNPSLKLCVGGHGGWLENDKVLKMNKLKDEGIKNFKILNENEAEILVDSRTTSETIYIWLSKKDYFIGGQPDPFDISIGGVLSIGGAGFSSISQGILAENVIELYGFKKGTTVIEKQNPYDFMCNLGKNGIITEVKLKCQKYENIRWLNFNIHFSKLNEDYYKSILNNKVKYFNQLIMNDISNIIIGTTDSEIKTSPKILLDNNYKDTKTWMINNNKKKALWTSWIFPNSKLYLKFFYKANYILMGLEKIWHIIIANNSNKIRPSHFPLTNTKYSYGACIYLYTDKDKWNKIKDNTLTDINKIALQLQGKPYLINVKID
jgi:hypothetical protein